MLGLTVEAHVLGLTVEAHVLRIGCGGSCVEDWLWRFMC